MFQQVKQGCWLAETTNRSGWLDKVRPDFICKCESFAIVVVQMTGMQETLHLPLSSHGGNMAGKRRKNYGLDRNY
jgi:hypothetical protein